MATTPDKTQLTGDITQSTYKTALNNFVDYVIEKATLLANHIANVSNPHSVTAAQINAVPTSDVSATVQANKIVQRDSNGKIAGDILGNAATATALSTPIATGIQGQYKSLKITNGGTPESQVSLTADQIILFNASSSASFLASNVSLTIVTTTTGTNALDTGSVANSTWYSVWVIYNGSTVAGLLSTSATAPTMPGGYTYKARLGWVRTGSDGNLMRTLQYGNSTKYVPVAATNTASYPSIASGSNGGLTAAAVTSVVPSTASKIGILAYHVKSSNNNYLAVATNVTSASIVHEWNGDQYVAGGKVAVETILESTNVYYQSNNGSHYINCLGWVDNL